MPIAFPLLLEQKGLGKEKTAKDHFISCSDYLVSISSFKIRHELTPTVIEFVQSGELHGFQLTVLSGRGPSLLLHPNKTSFLPFKCTILFDMQCGCLVFCSVFKKLKFFVF